MREILLAGSRKGRRPAAGRQPGESGSSLTHTLFMLQVRRHNLEQMNSHSKIKISADRVIRPG
jgi:hypothetical protein